MSFIIAFIFGVLLFFVLKYFLKGFLFVVKWLFIVSFIFAMFVAVVHTIDPTFMAKNTNSTEIVQTLE